MWLCPIRRRPSKPMCDRRSEPGMARSAAVPRERSPKPYGCYIITLWIVERAMAHETYVKMSASDGIRLNG